MNTFQVTYLVNSNSAKEVVEAIRVEQTIEFPFELAPSWIQQEVVGQVGQMTDVGNNKTKVVIEYNTGVAGDELPQLLNVLWGNVSMYPDVKIIDFQLNPEQLLILKGPRFGISGIRKIFKAQNRPILGTALKPMGSSSKDLAKIATVMVEAGIDLIKDDHSLANQPWALWDERVKVLSEAVALANSKFKRNSVYAPSINRPIEQIMDAAIKAKQYGCGALMVLPGIAGFDTMRAIADNDEVSLPIWSHPAMLGSLTMNPNHGFTHGLIYGTLLRLSGADISVFPNYGGRFSYTKEECLDIASNCRSPLGNIKTILPCPGGGMTVERMPEIIDFYGTDSVLLIGGALHRGNLLENSKNLRNIVDKFEN